MSTAQLSDAPADDDDGVAQSTVTPPPAASPSLTPTPRRSTTGEIVVAREEGESVHTVHMRPGQATAGSLQVLTVKYEQATLDGLDRASVTVGVDRGADATGPTVDEPLTAQLTAVSVSESESQLTLQFDDAVSVGVRDELVVAYRGVELSEDTQRVMAQLNPDTPGGRMIDTFELQPMSTPSPTPEMGGLPTSDGGDATGLPFVLVILANALGSALVLRITDWICDSGTSAG
ncbi:hypothetical protein [Halosegnis longus]|uniref:hypothetical protein n=1 Tax=Halosegnis longus TaxID=2216012 RepID=UPI0018F64205